MNYMNALIDTNILFYAYDTSQGEKHLKARAIVEDIFPGNEKAYVSVQNLAELFSTLVKDSKNPVKKEIAEEIINGFLLSGNWIKISYGPQTISGSMRIFEKGFHFWDCVIAATALENLITTIYTENLKDFEKIHGIKAINPLA